ncbi:MAG TPA: dipeptide epimerase, partial [Gemmatimonadaceae bacterium]|nr:dipeptide epimerase [Gemmatimonadaceae bacterium]
MKLSHEIVVLRTKHPFIIARGGASEYRVVRVTVTDDDGCTGWGEAAPSKHYGETADTVASVMPVLAPVLEKADGWSLEALERGLAKAISFNASARAAVSAALHDLAGKRLGVPLHRMWGLDPAGSPPTSFTIAIAPDESTLRDRVREAAGYPVLKIKLGTSWDERIVRIVREMEPGKVLRIDANAAWTPKHALHMIPILQELGVEFVEQPLPGHDLEGLRFVRERSSLPIIADESCLVSTDIPRLAGAVDGINIKLAKCGGLREAL